MQELIDLALDAAQRAGAGYADIRLVEQATESLTVKNGTLAQASSDRSAGFGVRVLIDGAWGFAASSRVERNEVERTTREAVAIARASGLATREPIVLDDSPPAVAEYLTPFREDPFAVPLDQKLRLLFDADETMAKVAGVTLRTSSMEASRERKTFASTEGARIEQELMNVGAGIEAMATNDSEVQRRSYPQSAGGQHVSGGFEAIRDLDLAANAQRIAEEAVALVDAPQCPSGTMTLIIDSPQLALQVHESCGHPSELDRVFGTEASYAGTSFLTTDKLDSGFRYGSDLVTIVADATAAGGMGTFGWDDEGVAAQAVPLVMNGIFSGYLSSRETAPRIGRRSGGAMRADGWNRIPLIRMTNVNLLPVDGMSLDDIVADTDDGLYLAQCRSWSIDDRRLNFQFATEVAYEIKGGKRGRLLKNPTYTGITYELWRSCDAIGDASSYQMLGTPNCGKGEPGQIGHIGHAVSGARFRDVQVGVLK